MSVQEAGSTGPVPTPHLFNLIRFDIYGPYWKCTDVVKMEGEAVCLFVKLPRCLIRGFLWVTVRERSSVQIVTTFNL